MVTIMMVVLVMLVVVITDNRDYDDGGGDGGGALIRNRKILESVRLYTYLLNVAQCCGVIKRHWTTYLPPHYLANSWSWAVGHLLLGQHTFCSPDPDSTTFVSVVNIWASVNVWYNVSLSGWKERRGCCCQPLARLREQGRSAAGWGHGWMDGRMDGWMDGWMDGQTDVTGRNEDRGACRKECITAFHFLLYHIPNISFN